ncbi:MAG: leucine-rich repeat domain-containing protein, partial [Lachnospiraceae bacterium]
MKKSGTKRKTNRKMKKAVRRTLGALFMISAIIVAAIPFPEAQAEPADGTTIPYSYPTSVEQVDIENANTSYVSNGTAYTISKPGGSNWQLDWQFEYYAETAGANGFITKYNNQYSVDEIELNYRVYSDYITIEEPQVNSYYTGTTQTTDIVVKKGDNANPPISINTLGYQYVLTGDPVTCPDHDFFYNYFLEEYNAYKTKYDEAELYKDDPVEAPNHPYPEEIKKTYKDVYKTDNEQMQYFCDQVFGTGTQMSLQVVDKRYYDETGIAKGWDKVYVPRVANKPTDTDTITINGIAYYVDANNFLANKFAALIGVAKEAFKDVHNVTTLVMAKEISYIGNSAFENSFLKNVTLSADAKIGNRAFANCSTLVNAVLPEGVQKIGAEAFAGTSLRDIVIPDSVTIIGDGAFHECGQLSSVTFDSVGSADKTIGDYAFYDCVNLSNVSFGNAYISSIGEAAFALSKAPIANLETFQFPDYITEGAGLGAYVLGGRDGLKYVIMPTNLGQSAETAIPDSVFWGCTGLNNVTFPDTCRYVSYSPGLFRQVTTPTFFVRGPKEDGHGAKATPRTSTWNAYFANSKDEHVPYVYKENGEDYYEVSDGTYVLLIDSKGILNSCNFIGTPNDIPELVVKTTVGTTSVTGIKDGCFSDPVQGTLNYIQKLVIEDSEIATVGDNVFKGAEKLKEVQIGNSV